MSVFGSLHNPLARLPQCRLRLWFSSRPPSQAYGSPVYTVFLASWERPIRPSPQSQACARLEREYAHPLIRESPPPPVVSFFPRPRARIALSAAPWFRRRAMALSAGRSPGCSDGGSSPVRALLAGEGGAREEIPLRARQRAPSQDGAALAPTSPAPIQIHATPWQATAAHVTRLFPDWSLASAASPIVLRPDCRVSVSYSHSISWMLSGVRSAARKKLFWTD